MNTNTALNTELVLTKTDTTLDASPSHKQKKTIPFPTRQRIISEHVPWERKFWEPSVRKSSAKSSLSLLFIVTARFQRNTCWSVRTLAVSVDHGKTIFDNKTRTRRNDRRDPFNAKNWVDCGGPRGPPWHSGKHDVQTANDETKWPTAKVVPQSALLRQIINKSWLLSDSCSW